MSNRAKFEEVMEMLRHKASEEAKTDIGESDPVNADALEQGKGAGSSVDEADGTPGERPDNGNGPTEQEAGDDPSNTPEGTAPEESEDSYKQTDATDGVELLKTAEALETVANFLKKEAAAQVVADHLAAEYAASIKKVAEAVEADLGIDEETASAIAEGLASGEISEEDLAGAAEQADMVMQLSEAMGVPPEEVLAAAQEIGETAEAQGVAPEELVSQALAQHQAAAEAEADKQLREAWQNAKAVLKQAEAEGDDYTAMRARAQLRRIAKIATGEDTEMPEDTAEEPAEESAEESSADVSGGEAPNAGVEGAEGGEGAEDLAAQLLEQGIDPDEVAAAQQAIEELQAGGVPDEVIAEMIEEEMAGQEIPHEASAEDIEQDPKLYSKLFVRAAVNEVRVRKAAAAEAADARQPKTKEGK